ncbi:hypothetical protein GcM3_089006 [Golovinomyces cichoracearum]|uniref:Uncharacterized protein n=1 Tax=Golovinomyces cichoracearum TaxID=62708 RepID=A0A420IIL9_9PEZI|nr:hypothetical protein GcM3_089006 [Golovinomyces cichoracearum]
MRKVSGTASSAFRAIWGDLEDQAELSVESGTELKPNIFKDSSAAPDGKENRKGIDTEEKKSTIVGSPRQFSKEDPSEKDLKAIGANLNPVKNLSEKLPSALTKKTEDSLSTPSSTKIALLIRPKNNSRNSRDLTNSDSGSPVQSRNEAHNDEHSFCYITGSNEILKEEAKNFQGPNGKAETLFQASRKIVQSDNEPNGKEAEIETDAYNNLVPQIQRSTESKDSSPIKFFDEKTPDDLPSGISAPSPNFPDETTTKNDNNSLNDLVPKRNFKFEASEEICTEDASKTSSEIHASHEEKHDSMVINWPESNILKNSNKSLANVESPTIDSNTLFEPENKVTSQNVPLNMDDDTTSLIETKYEAFKAIINPINGDMMVKSNDSVNYSENETFANKNGILFVSQNAPQIGIDENRIQIQDVYTTNDDIQATDSVDILKNNVKNQPEASNNVSSNLHDHTSIQENNNAEEISTEICLQNREDHMENIASNLNEQELNLVDSTEFMAEDINFNIASDPEREPVITDIKITRNVDGTDSVEKLDFEETDADENLTAQDTASDSCESIITEMKMPGDETKIDIEEDRDSKVEDVLTKQTSEDIKSDSLCQSIILETKAPVDETRIDAEEDQDSEVKDYLAKDLALDAASDSLESIITETKVPEHANQSDAIEKQDTEEVNTLESETFHDTATSSPCKSIITVIKALEDETRSRVVEDDEPEEMGAVGRYITDDNKSYSSLESIITEIKAPEHANQSDAIEKKDTEEVNTLENETVYEVARDSLESIITEIKAPVDKTSIDAEEDKEPEVKDYLAKDLALDAARDSLESIITEIKAPVDKTSIDAEEDQEPEVKDYLAKDLALDAARDSLESIITEIKLPEVENRSGALEEQDSKVTDFVAKSIVDNNKSDSPCESIITEMNLPEIATRVHEPQLGAKQDQVLSFTNLLTTHEPYRDGEMIRPTVEPNTSTEKKEERNLHETGLDEFKRVVNSRLLIRNTSEEIPTLLINQGLKSKTSNLDVASENEKSIEKSTDRKIRDKRANFTNIGAAESRTSILSLGSSKGTTYRPGTFGANNKFETHSSKVKQASIKNKFNANDNGSITTTKVKKSLKEKIMGKISGKLHKIKN